jgi:hypothetical protein
VRKVILNFYRLERMTSARNISASHTASEIIQLAKHIRRMGVSTVVIGSNILVRLFKFIQ